LREGGDVLTGEVFLDPCETENLLDRLEEARNTAYAVDWRLHDISMVPLRSVD